MELYSLALYLFAHFYLREAAKAETADVWPNEYAAWQQEPSSPMRMTARSWGRDASPSHKAHLPLMRQYLQQHLALQEALISGFGAFVARHAAALLSLVLNVPRLGSPGSRSATAPSSPVPSGMISAEELDRLGFLLSPAGAEAGMGSGSCPGGGQRRAGPEGGSPMDICPSTPFAPSMLPRLSEHTPFFSSGSGSSGGGGAQQQYVPLDAVAAWLTEQLRPLDELQGLGGDSMLGASPPRNSVFNRLVQARHLEADGNGSSWVQEACRLQAWQQGNSRAFCAAARWSQAAPPRLTPQVSSLACPTDIHGASRTTVVRGEEDFPSGSLRVLDCHDAVVYALAPLQYCLLSACSDCVVVLGAVGRVLRVERCERVQVRPWGRA